MVDTVASPNDEPVLVVPLHAEQAELTTNIVDTAEVQVSTTTNFDEFLVDELLNRQTAEIKRVEVGKFVDVMPIVRDEDGFLVIPVVEEIVEVRRKLVLKEEIYIRINKDNFHYKEVVKLRRQAVSITRTPVTPPSSETP